MRASHVLPLALAGAAAAACNGHDQLCDKKFSEVSFVGSHNSVFVGVGPSHNQYVSPTEQLEMGVRFLQARTQDKNGHPQMCHSSCILLDVGPIEDFLKEVADWINTNEDEVLTLLLTNNDGLPIEKFRDAFESTGLEEHVFRPEGRLSKGDWPTLGKLIEDGTRLVVFIDRGADTGKADYILPEFDYYWETPFGETDGDFPRCNVDRPGDGNPDELMSMLNHFLNIELPLGIKIPDQINARRTNSLDSITNQVDLCHNEHGTMSNVVLLDWINVGDAIEAQVQMNGL